MHFDFITLFPEVIETYLSSSILHRAYMKNLFTYSVLQLRDFSLDKHKTVDDRPFGGGEGMLLKVDVLHRAWMSIMENHYLKNEKNKPEFMTKSHPLNKAFTIYLSPQGELLNQDFAKEKLIQYSHIIFICGHYEGIDERFIELCVDQELSVGEYILSGGELAALTVADTLVRLIPGVLGNEDSVKNDSLQRGGLKYPQYTRPQKYLEMEVPSVLLSGHHQEILKWREDQADFQTLKKKPAIHKKANLKK